MTNETTRCTWCGRAGHVEADHPLPKTHPDYDAFYDASDDELAAYVSPNLGEATGV